MGDISKHFSRHEFACKCGCGFDTVDVETIAVLEDLRVLMGAPITVTSGCRCIVHNRFVGGADKSKHMEGRAADIVVEGKTPWQVYDYLCKRYKDKYCFLLYGAQGFVHVDTRHNDYREIVS